MSTDLTKRGISFLEIERKQKKEIEFDTASDNLVVASFVLFICYILATFSTVLHGI